MKIKKINVANDFSKSLGARYPEDGEFSGQKFLQDFLEKDFHEYEKIVINLDGTEGYPTAFSEEAFGGLARIYPIKEVLKKLDFISKEEPDLIKEIKGYIKKAKK